jgi:hypothetical protein
MCFIVDERYVDTKDKMRFRNKIIQVNGHWKFTCTSNLIKLVSTLDSLSVSPACAGIDMLRWSADQCPEDTLGIDPAMGESVRLWFECVFSKRLEPLATQRHFTL